MRVLNQIELFLDGSYPKEDQKAFIFKSRCLCNYLERALNQIRFETTLSRINIHCLKDAAEVRVQQLKDVPYLEVGLKYDLPSVSELDEFALQEHYIKIIDLGLKAAEDFMPVPYSYCMDIIQEFIKGGYKNEWVQDNKSWKKGGIHSIVLAELTMGKFFLTQSVYRDDDLVARKIIAEAMPREMLFLDYLGQLSMDRTGNIIYKRKRNVLSKFSLETNAFIDLDD